MMQTVRVIAAQGVTLRGPLTLKLNQDQIARRRPMLGTPGKAGMVLLDGDRTVQFKYGEEFGVDGFDRMNREQFEVVGGDRVAADKARTDAVAADKARTDAVAADKAFKPVGGGA